MTPAIELAPDAASRLSAELDGRVLRIAFTTGCGGSGYRLSLEGAANDGDLVFEENGVPIALDSMAASRLDGAVIRYNEEEDGYIVDHPDAVLTVWCG